MEILYDGGIQVVVFLQGLGEWLRGPMRLFSFLGDEYFFLLLMPIVYWAYDTRLGVRLGLLMLVSSSLSEMAKLLIHTARPFWYSTGIKAYLVETSFGMPSGHSFTASSVWGGLASFFRKAWIWIAAIFLIFFIGLSRVYNGVHFPHDLVTGWTFGGILLAVYVFLEKPVITWFKKQGLVVKIAASFGLSLVLIFLVVLAKLSLAAFTVPDVWMQNAAAFFPEEAFDPLKIAGVFSTSGALFGLCLGVILLPRLGGFHPGGDIWKRLARVFIGVAGVLAIYLGLKAIFPEGEYFLAYILRYARYALIGLWMAGIAPFLFVKTGLADARAKAKKPKKKVVKARRSYAG